jgi:hypothetical protein
MKTPIKSTSRLSFFVDVAMFVLMLWAMIDNFLRHEWVAAALFALVAVSAIFTFVSRRRDRLRQDSSTT